MDFAYNDEQKDIIKVVRDLVQKEIVPYAAEMDETGKLHEGLLEKLAAQGLLGVAIPEEFGGAGLDAITIAGVYEELAKGCGGVATTVAANALASYPVILAGNDDQKKRYFDVINEDNLAAFALTEPGTGSDAGSVSTRATKTEDGKGYLLNGTKCFITNGGLAEIFVVFANTRKTGGIRGLTPFIVRKGTPALPSVKKKIRWVSVRPTRRNSFLTTASFLLKTVSAAKAAVSVSLWQPSMLLVPSSVPFPSALPKLLSVLAVNTPRFAYSSVNRSHPSRWFRL